jgi:general secretion pathway protein A
MYERFYGFDRSPFQLLPDPDFLYRSKQHDSALAHLEYGLFNKAGFVVITGEIGTGKTTLLKYMLRYMDGELPVAMLSQSNLDPEQLLRALCQEFSLPHRGKEKSELLNLLGEFLVEQFRKRRHAMLIVDEAQNLPLDTLEEIRMLSNLDAENEVLLQIILVGQPALRKRLRSPGLRQLFQRIEVNYHLEPLDLEELKSYVRHRLDRAGGKDPGLFDDGALEVIFDYSGGVPRLINSICNLCMVYGMAENTMRFDRTVTESILKERFIIELEPEMEVREDDPDFAPESALELRSVATALGKLETSMTRLLQLAEETRAMLERASAEAPAPAAQNGEVETLRRRLAEEQARAQALEARLGETERKLAEVAPGGEHGGDWSGADLDTASLSPAAKDALVRQLQVLLAGERRRSARLQEHFRELREKAKELARRRKQAAAKGR